jgi:hypothetical protein
MSSPALMKKHSMKISEIVRREVLMQTYIEFGSVDWDRIGEAVVRYVASEVAFEALTGGDRVTIRRPA